MRTETKIKQDKTKVNIIELISTLNLFHLFTTEKKEPATTTPTPATTTPTPATTTTEEKAVCRSQPVVHGKSIRGGKKAGREIM